MQKRGDCLLKNNQLVEIPWTQTAQKYFGDLGYSFKKGETIQVSPEELPKGSHRIVTAVCDCCGKEIQIQYKQYLMRIKKHDGQYYCKDCFGKSKNAQQVKQEKTKNTCLKRYGVDNPMKDVKVQERLNETLKERYGTNNLMELSETRQKIKETCLNKYGVENVLSLLENQDKSKRAIQEKYGAEKAFQVKEIREKAKETSRLKYGVDYALQNEDVRKQAQETLAKSGKVPISKPQKAIFDLLQKHYQNCFLNYPESMLSLDCAVFLDSVKIDIEYDGWYWHQDQQKDIKRDRVVQKMGYKVLRIKGSSNIPKEEELLSQINELINSDQNYKEYWLDDYKQLKKKENINS